MTGFGRSLEEVLRIGESLYLTKFKEALEKDYIEQYAVIDIDQEAYVVNENQVVAIEEAKTKFGNKLFYIIRVGSLDKPTINYRKTQYAWSF